MENKIYVVMLEWCENSDDGKEIAIVTTDYDTAKQKFDELVKEELSLNKVFPPESERHGRPWVIMTDTETVFHHHGYFPDFCEIRIMEFIDPKPIM